MLRAVFFFIGLLLVNNLCLAGEPLQLDRKIHETSSVPFVPHVGKGKFANYLAQSIAFAPIERLRFALEKRLGLAPLKHRGEAHITVITPPEYWKLQPLISMEEINDRFRDQIQSVSFQVICLGAGEVNQSQKQSTYYVVVSSGGLLDIRKNVAEIFRSRGGKVADFDPVAYYPHITVGYTHRDLHIGDGVIKDARSCVSALVES